MTCLLLLLSTATATNHHNDAIGNIHCKQLCTQTCAFSTRWFVPSMLQSLHAMSYEHVPTWIDCKPLNSQPSITGSSLALKMIANKQSALKVIQSCLSNSAKLHRLIQACLQHATPCTAPPASRCKASGSALQCICADCNAVRCWLASQSTSKASSHLYEEYGTGATLAVPKYRPSHLPTLLAQ